MKVLIKNDEAGGGKSLTVATIAPDKDGKKKANAKRLLKPGEDMTVELNKGEDFEFSGGCKVYIKNAEADKPSDELKEPVLKVAVYARTDKQKKHVTNQLLLEPGQDKHFSVNEDKEFELHLHVPPPKAEESEYEGTDPRPAKSAA